MQFNNDLRLEVEKILNNPLVSIEKNFSLDKSRQWYDKRVEQWNNGGHRNNPAAKLETEKFQFATLDEMKKCAEQANNLIRNLNIPNNDFLRDIDWYVSGQNIVVSWYRLKTFEEWLHDGLRDALTMACDCPEDGARQLIEDELGEGIYSNASIHMFAEGLITKDILKRLGSYEKFERIEGRDVEEDIQLAKDILEKKKSSVTVLTLKI